MKLIGTRAVQTATVLNFRGVVKDIDYVKSNYHGIQLVASNTDIEDYDERFDAHYNMSDDGTYFSSVFHALNPGEDGIMDIEVFAEASQKIRVRVSHEIFINNNTFYNREDVNFMMEVLRNPAWTYTRFVQFGDWDLALEDALKVFDNSDMRDAMLNAISGMMAGLGVTSITFAEDDEV
jgi:hypothetical protein